MKSVMYRVCLVIQFTLLIAYSLHAQQTAPIGSGKLASLSVAPPKVEIVGRHRVQQLVVTGHYENGGVRDLTSKAVLKVENSDVATVENAVIHPNGNGATKIVIEVGGKSTVCSVTVRGADKDQPINFKNEIVPILTKMGCNTGACHGKAGGQNGFQLSLLGFDAKADYIAIAREGRGRRVFLPSPEHSLLLRKVTGVVGHGGGKKIAKGSPEYELLKRWIASGLRYGDKSDPSVVGISVWPKHRFVGPDAHQQLMVTAHFSDGGKADVTRRAEFRSNDEDVLEAEGSRIRSTGRTGESSVMVRYLGFVDVFRATIPQSLPEKVAWPTPNNFIDEHAFAKLKALGIPPSKLCSDGEFLRRVSLDITGSLPTAEEAEGFLKDNDPKKREKLVDELLKRPAYASYFTMKWADILRVRGGVRDRRKPKKNSKKPVLDTPAKRADEFHAWIKQSIERNKPFDQFVREILTTTGPSSGKGTPPPILWYIELKKPSQIIDDVAQAFLGTRIQCAQCHHHPFEKWSQDDYWGLATFFGRFQWEREGKDKKFSMVRWSEAGRIGQHLALTPKGGLTDPQGNEYKRPRPLGGKELDIPESLDPRHTLVDWMAAPDNPFFARALVNRYWGHFFGRGIVHPVDDLRVTNPPSNPALLDALAQDFVQKKFDLKHLIRTICTSKLYQLSSTPNEYNKQDKVHYARFLPRRIVAEALHDAVDRVTETETIFVAKGGKKFPPGTRAIDLPDTYVSSYFLSVFGKPSRESACECERGVEVTLAQRAHLLNNGTILRKLSERAKKLLEDKRSNEEKIRTVYLEYFTRPPTKEETSIVLAYLEKHGADARNRQSAWTDVLWALLNTKEFMFQH